MCRLLPTGAEYVALGCVGKTAIVLRHVSASAAAGRDHTAARVDRTAMGTTPTAHAAPADGSARSAGACSPPNDQWDGEDRHDPDNVAQRAGPVGTLAHSGHALLTFAPR